jgi:hypothetical protein
MTPSAERRSLWRISFAGWRVVGLRLSPPPLIPFLRPLFPTEISTTTTPTPTTTPPLLSLLPLMSLLSLLSLMSLLSLLSPC